MSQKEVTETVFFCDLTALRPEERKRHQRVLQELGSTVEEVREIPDGYAFRHPPEGESVRRIAEFITLERLCCPFLDFTLEVAANRGPVWLHLTGPEGVKELLRAELGFG
jgi:hypothetical protein